MSASNEDKCIIFGFDGVIFETDIYHFLSWKKTLQEINVYVDDRHRSQLTGLSRNLALEYFIEAFNLNLTNEEKEKLLKINDKKFFEFTKNLSQHDIPPNIFELIHYLRSAGIKVGLLPNTKFVIDFLNKFEMDDLFDYVPSKELINSHKHEKQALISDICDSLGVKQYNGILIDSSQESLDLATQMLLRTIGIGHDKKLYGVLEQLSWVEELTVDKVKELISRVFDFKE